MSLALKRIKVYSKLGAIGVVVVAGSLVLLKNWEHKATIWFFHKYEDVPVLWLLAITAASSILLWSGARRVLRVVSEMRDLRRNEASQRQMDEQRKLAEEVAEREKRIDEKIRKSLSNGG